MFLLRSMLSSMGRPISRTVQKRHDFTKAMYEYNPKEIRRNHMKAVAVLLVAGAWFYFVWDIVKDGEREKEQHIDIMKGYPYETTPVWRNYKTKDWPWECKECTLFDMDCQKACKARLRQEKLAKKAAAQEAKKGASAANGSDSQ